MAKIYYNLVIKGTITIEQVPSKWRDAVQAMIDKDNNSMN